MLAPNHSWNGLTRPAQINDNLSQAAAGSRSSAALPRGLPASDPGGAQDTAPGKSATSPGWPGGSAEALAGNGDVIRAPRAQGPRGGGGREPGGEPGGARQAPGSAGTR